MKPILSLIAVTNLFAAFAVAQPARYTVVDLGNVRGTPGQAYSIKNNGIVAGAAASGGATHAVLWYNNSKLDLGTLGGNNSAAFGANDRGEIAGEAESSTPDPANEDFCGFKALGLPSLGTTCLPFVWRYSLMSPLPTLGPALGPKGNIGAAEAINIQGQVVGTSENTTPDATCGGPGVTQVSQFKPVLLGTRSGT